MSWHHAPSHHFAFGNTFFITGATDHKQHFYREPATLDELHEILFANAEKHQCMLQSWCLLSNHYHLVARGDGANVRRMVTRLHVEAAIARNRRDGVKGRQVWYQFWDSHITFERSYLARLNYVHHNPVHHGVTDNAMEYRWCSARWFTENAPAALVATVKSCNTDKI
ncbi:MAG: transposase [Thermoanaerobaculia bacterium]